MNPDLQAIAMLKQKLRDGAMSEIRSQYKQGGEEDQNPTIAESMSDLSPIVEEEPLPPEVLEFLSRLM